MANFPTSLPAAGSASSSATLAAAGHTALHNNGANEAVAIATKVGTGASTPTSGQVLRSTGAGTSLWGAVSLTTDVTGTLGVGNGGTGATSSTGTGSVVLSTSPTLTTPAISTPTITSGGSWSGSPTIVTPTIASFVGANHDHSNATGGGGLGAGIITYANLLATIFSSQLTTYTNPGSAGGTSSFFYGNIGGIRLFWGVTANQTSSSGGNTYTITLPVGFFNTIQTITTSPINMTSDGRQFATIPNFSTTTISLTIVSPNGAAGSAFSVFVVGT